MSDGIKFIKVILYGVRSQKREWVEKYINKSYKIISYTDLDPEYNELTEFDYKPFVKIENLKNINFDYILILPNEKLPIKEIYENLLYNDIEKEKIIYWENLIGDYRNPLKEFYNLNREFEGFIFGMSHSFNGFLTHYFDKKFFKFAAPSMDLYFHLNVLNNIRKSDLLKKANYFIFELPYYIFNYDISKCKNTCKIRMNYLEMFNDYHNYGMNEEEKRNIKVYNLIKDMFINRNIYNFSSNNFENKSKASCSKEERENMRRDRDHVLYKFERDTIQENLLIWKKIIGAVKEINIHAKIAVVIYPNNPYAIECHKEAFDKMKKMFYQLIAQDISEKIYIYDYHAVIEENQFIDHCHLNGQACINFSKFLNKELEKKFY